MKKIISLLLTASIFLGASGCFFRGENPYPYTGEYKELYTAAVYSIPDAVGYMHHGEGAYPSDIHIWEQDDYGRTLFSYCEDYGNQIFALVICQAYDEANVYFYPDANYALTLIDSEYLYEGVADNYLENQTEAFYLETGDQLKLANDWNQPLDLSKCASYPITDHKVQDQAALPLSSDRCDEILLAYTEKLHLRNPEKSPHRYNSILQADDYGRVLHEISGVHQNFDKPNPLTADKYTYYHIVLWVITDPEGGYDPENGILVMFSRANAPDRSFIYDAETVREFKNRNGWNNASQ